MGRWSALLCRPKNAVAYGAMDLDAVHVWQSDFGRAWLSGVCDTGKGGDLVRVGISSWRDLSFPFRTLGMQSVPDIHIHYSRWVHACPLPVAPQLNRPCAMSLPVPAPLCSCGRCRCYTPKGREKAACSPHSCPATTEGSSSRDRKPYPRQADRQTHGRLYTWQVERPVQGHDRGELEWWPGVTRKAGRQGSLGRHCYTWQVKCFDRATGPNDGIHRGVVGQEPMYQESLCGLPVAWMFALAARAPHQVAWLPDTKEQAWAVRANRAGKM